MRHLTILMMTSNLILFASIEGFAGGDAMKGPWEHSFSKAVGGGAKTAFSQEEVSSLPSFALLQSILFFKNTISKVDGDRCPSYPTCAAYGEMVVRKHGFIIGILMTVDRLIHEASESKTSPVIKKYDVPRIYDPPENNDFWFTK